MLIMVFNICNSNDFNRQQCMKDWDTWLIPELQKGWDIITEKEKPYQEEKNKPLPFGFNKKKDDNTSPEV